MTDLQIAIADAIRSNPELLKDPEVLKVISGSGPVAAPPAEPKAPKPQSFVTSKGGFSKQKCSKGNLEAVLDGDTLTLKFKLKKDKDGFVDLESSKGADGSVGKSIFLASTTPNQEIPLKINSKEFKRDGEFHQAEWECPKIRIMVKAFAIKSLFRAK